MLEPVMRRESGLKHRRRARRRPFASLDAGLRICEGTATPRARRIRRMELYQLKTFVAIAQEGSLTRAAERVFTSAPAVSAQLKAL